MRTRVRFRIEEDPESGELVSRSYEVGKKRAGSGPGAVCKTAG
ncbi:S-type pyocin domain-containing protein [Klebsiella pneumoniae subsp. pneumoniae]|nr:S-type pyocin domain-containing protein [Klebsiella pneumoniae subsp. pneumoniae]